MIKKIDEAGRIVLPRPIRKELGITEETPLDISIQDGMIVIEIAKGVKECPKCHNVVVDISNYCYLCGTEIPKEEADYGTEESII